MCMLGVNNGVSVEQSTHSQSVSLKSFEAPSACGNALSKSMWGGRLDAQQATAKLRNLPQCVPSNYHD